MRSNFHSIFSSWLLHVVPLLLYMFLQRADSSIWIDLGARFSFDFLVQHFFLSHFWTQIKHFGYSLGISIIIIISVSTWPLHDPIHTWRACRHQKEFSDFVFLFSRFKPIDRDFETASKVDWFLVSPFYEWPGALCGRLALSRLQNGIKWWQMCKNTASTRAECAGKKKRIKERRPI